MTTKLAPDTPVVIPVDEETRALLNYAASAEGRAHIDKARQEIRDGKFITVTPGYFEAMKQRTREIARKRANRQR